MIHLCGNVRFFDKYLSEMNEENFTFCTGGGLIDRSWANLGFSEQK